MSGISTDFKELVRQRTDIVQLIGESLSLIPSGAEYKCLCPFHDDHNPSMRVYPDRQSFRCWVCNQGGDVFTFVQEREGVSFFDALKMLADRAHLEMPDRPGFKKGPSREKKAALYEVLKWAELQFHECLLKSREAQDARDYITDGRGYTPETIESFRLGYHPDDWEWIARKARSHFSTDVLLESQLIKPRDERPGYTDYFVDRVLFPIHDENRRTVAFGGRLIPGHREVGGKYFNSKESPVFHKSRVLYGLPYARDAIREYKSVLVTEGYADCVACHQYGVKNVVATLGTALTEQQCNRLRGFVSKIVMVYDADKAGQDAAAKSVSMLMGQSVDLRILSLPEGKDPDDFLKKHGGEAFQQLIETAQEAWDFRLDYEVRRKGLDTVHGREALLTEMLGILVDAKGLAGSVREDVIVGRLASRLQLSDTAVRMHLDRMRKEGPARRPAPSRSDSGPSGPPVARKSQPATSSPADHDFDPALMSPPPDLMDMDEVAAIVPMAPRQEISFYRKALHKDDLMETELLEVLMTRPELAERCSQEIGTGDFQNPHLKTLLQMVYDQVELGELPSFDRIMLELEDSQLKGLLVWITEQAESKGVEAKLTDDFAERDGSGLLSQLLDQLKWRREELSHQAYLNRQAVAGQNGETDPLAKLKQAAAFHQKRVSKR